MQSRLAILAGTGALPQILAEADPSALFVSVEGIKVDVPPDMRHFQVSFEKIGALFEALHSHGVRNVVFAGAMARPSLNPAQFDDKTRAMAPRLMMAMQQGDDTLLREFAALFEEEGYVVAAAHEVVPGLLMPAQTLIGPPPDKQAHADAARGLDVLAALASQDVSQCAVVAGGQVLGIETVQGTDAMLDFVARTPPELRRARGVLVKGPKPGQDMRFDVPTIGAQTVRAAARAGLAGMFIPAGGVNVLDRGALEAALKDTGLFLVAR